MISESQSEKAFDSSHITIWYDLVYSCPSSFGQVGVMGGGEGGGGEMFWSYLF